MSSPALPRAPASSPDLPRARPSSPNPPQVWSTPRAPRPPSPGPTRSRLSPARAVRPPAAPTPGAYRLRAHAQTIGGGSSPRLADPTNRLLTRTPNPAPPTVRALLRHRRRHLRHRHLRAPAAPHPARWHHAHDRHRPHAENEGRSTPWRTPDLRAEAVEVVGDGGGSSAHAPQVGVIPAVDRISRFWRWCIVSRRRREKQGRPHTWM